MCYENKMTKRIELIDEQKEKFLEYISDNYEKQSYYSDNRFKEHYLISVKKEKNIYKTNIYPGYEDRKSVV